MPPKLTCPFCSASLKSKEGIAGKRVRCPKCSQIFVAPEPVHPPPVVQPPVFETMGDAWPPEISTSGYTLPPIDMPENRPPVQSYQATSKGGADSPLKFLDIAPGGGITAHWNNAKEAKLAIKECRALKRHFSLQKKQNMEQQRVIRAQYTHLRRQQGSKMRGGGFIGHVIRAVQTASRDSERAQLAHDLAPLEYERQQIEAGIAAVDDLIHQIECSLLGY